MAKIDILMATYNGAKYVATQIRSLQSQTFTDWRLLIHDDGSSDDTLNVLRHFAQSDARIVLLEDGVQCHGPARNFMHLLQHSDSPFVMFCDQDDIWLENKVQDMLDTIQKADNALPQMVYSNSYVYDTASGTIDGYATLWNPTDLREVLFANAGIQGCALLFNASLRSICVNVPPVMAMHDHVLTLAALTFGELRYVDKRLMLYRRHGMAVTGATYKNAGERFAHFFQRGKTVLDAKHVDAIHSFLQTYRNMMPEDKLKLFLDFDRFLREGRLRNVLHALRGGYRLFGKRSILVFKILIRKMI